MSLGRQTTIERAFELARSGRVGSVAELRRALSREGYLDVRAQTDGPALGRQLMELIQAARRAAAE